MKRSAYHIRPLNFQPLDQDEPQSALAVKVLGNTRTYAITEIFGTHCLYINGSPEPVKFRTRENAIEGAQLDFEVFLSDYLEEAETVYAE